ncbi:hypothetical protein [Paludibacterium denitrificans]|uniref:hypothetical protein n=1 Tax=Paludibacterium denitrificans TaxID=2675226 RepID=UPI001E4F6830|nr:hypothetical protein [Paludibacterium denitrificans]
MTPTTHIQTVSGRYVDLLHPVVSDIDITDIAHHLSHLCRFGGACREFYSVADHSVRVATILLRRRSSWPGFCMMPQRPTWVT